MSKLDDIFKIQVGEEWTTAKSKQQVKDLFMEIVGEDDPEDHFTESITVAQGLNAPTRNKLRAKQRQRINEL